jgi:hypothetical protein
MGTLPLAAVVLVAAGLVLGLLPELLRRPALRPLTAD